MKVIVNSVAELVDLRQQQHYYMAWVATFKIVQLDGSPPLMLETIAGGANDPMPDLIVGHNYSLTIEPKDMEQTA